MAKTKAKPVKEKVLSSDHLRQLEIGDRDIQNAKLSMALEEQVLQNFLIQLEVLKSRIEKQKESVQVKAKEYNQTLGRYQTLRGEIVEIYNVGGDSLAYDSNTGHIV